MKKSRQFHRWITRETQENYESINLSISNNQVGITGSWLKKLHFALAAAMWICAAGLIGAALSLLIWSQLQGINTTYDNAEL